MVVVHGTVGVPDVAGGLADDTTTVVGVLVAVGVAVRVGVAVLVAVAVAVPVAVAVGDTVAVAVKVGDGVEVGGVPVTVAVVVGLAAAAPSWSTNTEEALPSVMEMRLLDGFGPT